MMKNMNFSTFKKACDINDELASKWYIPVCRAIESFNIVDNEDVAMFLAQAYHESNGFKTLLENLNYSSSALCNLFGTHRITHEQAALYGRNENHKANQEALANIIYGGEWGRHNLGNVEPGDGWLFRGRGLKQITGRSNYASCGNALSLDLISNPDLLLNEDNAALSAAWFYVSKGCLKYKNDVEKITKIINGGGIGLEQRKKLYSKILFALNKNNFDNNF